MDSPPDTTLSCEDARHHAHLGLRQQRFGLTDGHVFVAGSRNAEVFDATAKVIASHKASEVWGPYGMVVAGTYLPCGAYHPVQ